MKVYAYIEKQPNGQYRIRCKRAKHKWWFELGQHAETDAAFVRALYHGIVVWWPEIVTAPKKMHFFAKK